MALPKPTTAAGYNAEHTLACERALVTLLRGFGTFKQSLRLVGGLVPRYLTPERPPDVPAHVGTSDVDIVLNIQVLADGDAYKTLAQQLKERGFARVVNERGQASSWRWQRQGEEHEFVVVEFLRDAGDTLPPGSVSTVEDERVSALAIRHVGIVHDWFAERAVTAELLDGGGITTETVRFADAVSFIVLKAIAYDERHENKDAADLIHVMRYAGELNATAKLFADRLSGGKHVDAISEALGVLERRFCDGQDVEGYLRDGPVSCGTFAHGPEVAMADDRIREQRNVSGLVTEFLRLVQERRDLVTCPDPAIPA